MEEQTARSWRRKIARDVYHHIRRAQAEHFERAIGCAQADRKDVIQCLSGLIVGIGSLRLGCSAGVKRQEACRNRPHRRYVACDCRCIRRNRQAITHATRRNRQRSSAGNWRARSLAGSRANSRVYQPDRMRQRIELQTVAASTAANCYRVTF